MIAEKLGDLVISSPTRKALCPDCYDSSVNIRVSAMGNQESYEVKITPFSSKAQGRLDK